jgi:hypothetical protein
MSEARWRLRTSRHLEQHAEAACCSKKFRWAAFAMIEIDAQAVAEARPQGQLRRFAFLLWRRKMIIKTRHRRGVAIAAFMIVAAATVALEFYAGINWSDQYSGFTAGL